LYFKSDISSIFDGTYAYIYIWFSTEYKSVYVGQTNSESGVLGRAHGHVGRSGTLRHRFFDAYGEPLEHSTDWILLSFRLPAKKKFTSVESSYRLAVEYRVQSQLNEVRGDISPPFRIISNVTYTDHCSAPEVVSLSEEIIEAFKSNYSNS
jgi:hypothetical protein